MLEKEMLESGDENSPDVKRLIITIGERANRAILALLERRPELFKGKRLLNIKLPKNYQTMSDEEKTVWQVNMLVKAIFARLYEENASEIAKTIVKSMFADSVSNVEGFMANLAEPKNETPEDTKERIKQYLLEDFIVKLIRILEHEREIMKIFCTYA